jgi:hypothetical protein
MMMTQKHISKMLRQTFEIPLRGHTCPPTSTGDFQETYLIEILLFPFSFSPICFCNMNIEINVVAGRAAGASPDPFL